MTTSVTQKSIRSWPISQLTSSKDEADKRVLSPTVAEWRFKKEATNSADRLENKLQIHKQLTEVGAPVQKLLSYKRFEKGNEQVIQTELENIPYQPSLNWRHVNECLDAMISCFASLTEIHANNVYHGDPCSDNFIFQKVNRAESAIPETKGYLKNLHNCGHINGDPNLSARDVQIALSDFGSRLLLIAENSGYTKIRVLRMHLESQVNFADQNDLDALENAPTLLNHLCSLKTLLDLRHKDYPYNHQPAWGPLNQEQVQKEYLELQKQKQSVALEKTAKEQFKFPHCLKVKALDRLEPSNNKPTTDRREGFKTGFFTTNTAGIALLTAGAMMTWLSIRAKQIDKN